jgi:hypothetical protein
MKEKGRSIEFIRENKVDVFQSLVEEYELEDSITHFKEQQKMFGETMDKHFRIQRRNLSDLTENFDELSHSSRHLKKHVGMVQTQCEQIAKTQALLLEQGSPYKAISTNIVTRRGTTTKDPVGPPWWEVQKAQRAKDMQEMTQEEDLADP